MQHDRQQDAGQHQEEVPERVLLLIVRDLDHLVPPHEVKDRERGGCREQRNQDVRHMQTVVLLVRAG